ncbi:MAG: ExeM/NucH family extracellular endonuclease, partial [Nocardioides sp.]
MATTALGLVTSVLALGLGAPTQAASTGLVISEVYGAGGNANASYTHDYVELYNPTASSISLASMSVQYRSSTSTAAPSAGGVSSLASAGSVAPGDSFVIQLATGGAVGTPVPNVDFVGNSSSNLSATNGQVYLANSTTAIDPDGVGNVAITDAAVIDFVGFGTAAIKEGATAAPAPTSNSVSITRNETGTDTDVNGTDFFLAAPTPGAAYAPPPPPAQFTGTIAEIQGTDSATSPHVADIATTKGVVTAVYPTGGFNGFFLQTEGTGGAVDATPGASDGIFVFGSNAMAAAPVIGDYLQVVGEVVEFGSQTQLVAAAGGVTKINGEAHTAPVARVAPLPGSDCAVGSCPTATELAAAREAHESEAFAPTGPFTVTNTFSLTNGANGFMEIGLAADTKPLIAPTEVSDAQTGNVAARTAYNNAHAVTLDDGSSLNYTTTSSGNPMPWITKDKSIRVGAATTFTGPVVLDFRNNAWKVQPTSQVTGLGEGTATFTDTRPANALPQVVGGDLKLGTFNVLNYFNTTGVAFDAQPGTTCSYFNDRTATNPVTVSNCTPDGPRGAAEQEDFLRQQAKIIRAINTMDTDIVSLEEIENSVKLIGETDRDDALGALVAALNADAGGTRWAFAPSPDAADLPTLTEQDVIRTAFIYDPTTVELVGASKVLVGSAPFANAREPLAQAFKAKGAPDADAFGVIVNHFKSKGSGADDGTGQGNANPDRVAQAQALVTFADSFTSERSITKLFLTGDFNAYSAEDPIQVLEAAGYAQLESDTPGEESYSFSGLSGSLDHVLANAAAVGDVTGVDIWDINAGESIAYQYSRFN